MARNDRKEWNRRMRMEIRVVVKYNKHELESSIRHSDDVVNGSHYKKLSRGVKYSYIS